MINRDEWLTALHEAGIGIPDEDAAAITVGEFAALIGSGVTVARVRMRALVAAGKARRVEKRIRDSQGRTQTVPAYRLEAK